MLTSQGASLIRMIEKVVGPETLKKGLKLYMEKHKYANTHNIDLWAAISEVKMLLVVSCNKRLFRSANSRPRTRTGTMKNPST